MMLSTKYFIIEHNSWEKKKDLKNAKKVVVEFKKRSNTKVRKQEKLDIVEKRDFKREELLEKYIVKLLYR